MYGATLPCCKKVVKISVLRPHFKVDHQNGLIMTGIFTAAVLCSFIFNLWFTRYVVIPNYIYKVIQVQGC